MAYTPRPLRDLVGSVFREHQREDHITLAAIQKRWADLVGPGVAERTWPTRLQKGLLWIVAPDSSWAYQLQFLKRELLGGLHAGMPGCLVTELRFKVGPLPLSAAVVSGARLPPPESADPLPAPELSRAAEAIADPTLKAAFLRAMSKQAQRKAAKPHA